MVVIITGASSGIGFATASFLAEKGFKVYGISRNNFSDEHFENLTCDVTDFDAVEKTFKYIYEKEGKIDVLINNAGMGVAGAIEHTENENIKKLFDLNLLAVINGCKSVTPYMRSSGGGKIINIGSVAGVIPIPFQACYSASKAAVESFSMAFGLEVKDFKIQLTTIMPGDTKTGFTSSRIKNELLVDDLYKDRINNSINKMEKDERNGVSPLCVSNVIYKIIRRKKSPTSVTVGFNYKAIVFFGRILPRKFMLKVIKKMYG